jgi:hypothetical protein
LNGGGWLTSNTGAKKATFGFTWAGDDCDFDFFSGSVVCDPTRAKGFWSDGTVQFRIADGGLESLGVFSDGCWHGSGQYVAQGRTRGTGDIDEIIFCDEGEPGPSAGDYVEITVSGIFTYHHEGELLGGNLKQTKPEEP